LKVLLKAASLSSYRVMSAILILCYASFSSLTLIRNMSCTIFTLSVRRHCSRALILLLPL